MALILNVLIRLQTNLTVNFRCRVSLRKKQDICTVPNEQRKSEKEKLNFEGILYGQEDKFGLDFTEKALSINIFSQLSSSAKNFDTLYERTFAEALNFHF